MAVEMSGDESKSVKPRSRSGCFTCRKRKKRCDEVRPLCGACKRLNLACEYPAPGLERKNKKRKTSLDGEGGNLGDTPAAPAAIDHSVSPSTLFDGRDFAFGELFGVSTPQTSQALVESAFGNPLDELIATTGAGPMPAGLTTITSGITEINDELEFEELMSSSPEEKALTLSRNPSAWQSLQLDATGMQLFDYFRYQLAPMICVSTEDSNSFLNVFVPMAHEDSAVLYSIVSWAGFHKERGKFQDTGLQYLNKSIVAVKSSMPATNYQKYTRLASMLLICAAEICSGDVVHWDKHLSLAAKMISENGGLGSFVHDRTLRWLASNFAYHDLLASSTSCARNTHFPAEDYDQILKHGYGLDALVGCCQPLFKVLAEISDMAVEAQNLYRSVRMGIKEPGELKTLRNKVQALEQQISSCHPDPIDMISLSPDQLTEQLNLFETFQLASRLHLRQTVTRVNSNNLEIQCMNQDLISALDQVMGTRVEGGVVFPLFIAGIHSSTETSRQAMRARFDDYYERNLARNIKRARFLLEEVWSRDENGSRHVDWYGIIQNRGWDICFA
ncbi:transcriptional activator protein Uga3p [Trichomonascus vanleenenianus]|uniref:Zn(II)2Cys6 transcription factor n=1 Tax=Trichomonascus vanleenenianus TaxID=2268995 RepID=UPI003EC9C933